MRRTYPLGKRLGLTLVEVVVGLAIAGTLLSAVIITSTHHAKQMRLADQKRSAAELADRFLSRWSHYGFRDQDQKRAIEEVRSLLDPSISREFLLRAEQVGQDIQLEGGLQSNSIQAVQQASDFPRRLEAIRVSVFDALGHRVTYVDIARMGDAQ